MKNGEVTESQEEPLNQPREDHNSQEQEGITPTSLEAAPNRHNNNEGKEYECPC